MNVDNVKDIVDNIIITVDLEILDGNHCKSKYMGNDGTVVKTCRFLKFDTNQKGKWSCWLFNVKFESGHFNKCLTHTKQGKDNEI